jgi:hypothetical protein
MLDPRIYRTGLIAVAVGAILLAFSFNNQPGPVGTTLPPEAFNGQNAYRNMLGLAEKFPDRSPGSAGDNGLAAAVAKALHRDGFSVTTKSATAHTAEGTRTLKTVTAVRPGLSSDSIVVVSHRDSGGSPDTAGLSGTAVLLELARVLSGETQHHPLVLVSTSGSAGSAGASQVARNLGSSVDAVIVLGDLAGSGVREPIVVPWSNGEQVAPPVLRNTLSADISAQAGFPAGQASLLGQVAHLAFPLTVTEQGPFGENGYPAALVSLAGQRPPDPGAAVTSRDRINGLGQAMLQAVNSLDGASAVPAPAAYLLFDGKLIPPWAVRLFVLALVVPVLLTAIDGTARARRRGHPIMRWMLWVLAGALPFLLGVVLVLGAKLVGLLGVTPPAPLGPGQVPLAGAGIVVLAVVGAAIVLMLLFRKQLVALLIRTRPPRPLGSPSNPGAGAALLLVMCALTLGIWVRNPYAAALLVPALHLWMWVLDPGVRMPRPLAAVLLLAGFAPPVLVALYYGRAFGLGPVDAAWTGVLMIAGGYVGLVNALLWSLVLGCFASAISIAIRRPRPDRPKREEVPITVRGPITYAGPGSLGGTKSASRR